MRHGILRYRFRYNLGDDGPFVVRDPIPRRQWPGGLVGTYALHLMSRGPIYGGELTQRIDDVTRGAWRPGAGAVYPILTALVERGEAHMERVHGRKVYSLTPRGEAQLAEARSRLRERGRRFGERQALMLDMVDPAERSEVLIETLRRAIETVAEFAASPDGLPDARARSSTLRRARAELRRGLSRLEAETKPSTHRGRSR